MAAQLTLLNGDMLQLLPSIPAHSVDAVITDLPYGTLNKKRNQWDRIVNFEEFWTEIKNVSKPSTPLISTTAQPFTTALIASNYKDFKYTMVWEKSKATGYLNAKKQPMRAHEDIVVFYDKQCTYHPQMVEGKPYDKGTAVRDTQHYGKQSKATHIKSDGSRYPRSIQYFKTAETEGKLHPTQKPVSLYEWLILTYTNPGDTVLDPCMGSGTTGIAALKLGRNFIGIEADETYFKTAENRLTLFQNSLNL